MIYWPVWMGKEGQVPGSNARRPRGRKEQCPAEVIAAWCAKEGISRKDS